MIGRRRLSICLTAPLTATSMGAQPAQRRTESFEKATLGPLTKLATTVGVLYEGSTAHMTFQRIPLTEFLKGSGS